MKKIIALLLATMMFLSLTPAALAAEDEATAAADKLHALGLFNGIGTDEAGNPIFALDRAPTRHEAVTMLVRLLGKEAEALAGKWEIPFTDVADWAKPYVGYAYAKGLTNGISPTAFGGENTVSAAQYLTFVLRALGYKSGVDFVWERAWELSDRLGITNGEYNAENDTFVRGDIAIISADALEQPLKDDKVTLAERIKAEKEKHKDDKPKDDKPQTEAPSASIVSEPSFSYSGDVAVYVDGSSYAFGTSYRTGVPSSLRVTMTVKGLPVKEFLRVNVSRINGCTVTIEKDGSFTVTGTEDGRAYLQIFYVVPTEPAETKTPETAQTTPGQEAPDTSRPAGITSPRREQRTDMYILFGSLPKVPGISLERHDQIYPSGSAFGTLGQSIFVPIVLFDGEPVSDYTVSSDDPNTRFTVQADGSLLIEKFAAGTVSYTITCRGQTASFRVTS